MRSLLAGVVLMLVADGTAAQVADSASTAVRGRLWLPPGASLVAPGAGQLLTGRDRGLVYIAAEVFFLSRFLQLNHDGLQGRDRYRELAFMVAQHGFATQRRDTAFRYYEALERFTASGVFDRNPSGAFTPENDLTTYNGLMWQKAQRIFWPDPTHPPIPGSQLYLEAIDFYRAHAIGPNYYWSWRDAPLAQQQFQATLKASDKAFRSAHNQLGLLLANHLVSAVDALISSRLSARLRQPATLQTTYLGHRGMFVSVCIAF